jgi:hypothetical protein
MRFCNKGEGMSVVSDSEVFVTFVTPDIEGSARNMSEWNKIK